MFTDPYNKCSPTETETVLKQLTGVYPNHGFRVEGLAALRKTIGFYGDAIYYDLTQADLHPAPTLQFVIGKNGDVLILDGRVESILAFNATQPFRLDRHLVMDYVRFYLAHVTGLHGITTLIDMVEDLDLREEPTPGLRKSLHDKIVPLALNGSLPGSGYQLRATLLIGSSLYTAMIDVGADGAVTAAPSRVLADHLPVQDAVLER